MEEFLKKSLTAFGVLPRHTASREYLYLEKVRDDFLGGLMLHILVS